MHETKTPIPPNVESGIQSCVRMLNYQLGSEFININPKTIPGLLFRFKVTNAHIVYKGR